MKTMYKHKNMLGKISKKSEAEFTSTRYYKIKTKEKTCDVITIHRSMFYMDNVMGLHAV